MSVRTLHLKRIRVKTVRKDIMLKNNKREQCP